MNYNFKVFWRKYDRQTTMYRYVNMFKMGTIITLFVICI